MKKDIFKITIFISVLTFIFVYFNGVFRIKRPDGIYNMDIFYEQPKNSIDVMFFGSSHVFQDINPAVLWDENGVASYVLGGSIQPLWNTYYYINEALKYQKPKVLVVELYRACESREYIQDERVVVNTFGMKMSFDKVNAIKASIDKSNWNDYILQYPIYHSRYNDLKESDFDNTLITVDGKDFKGYVPAETIIHYEELKNISTITEKKELPKKNKEYLLKIINLSKANNIPLLFIVSPYPSISDKEQMYYNECQRIAEENNIPYINFNLKYNELGLSPMNDFADVSHLNLRGSYKYTKYLGQYLVKNYSLENKKGQKVYDSWNRNSEILNEVSNNYNLITENNFDKYIENLERNGNYTVVISCNGNLKKSKNYLDVKEKIVKYGVEEGIIEGNGIQVLDNRQTLYNSNKEQGSKYIKLGKNQIDILVENNILYKGKEQKKVANGINIIVYDKKINKLVDSVGFDSEKSFSIVRKLDK